MNYQFSGPHAKSPRRGQQVSGHIYVSSCIPGNPPLFDYDFKGEFIGECADGFMVRPTWRSDASPDTTIICCRQLHGEPL